MYTAYRIQPDDINKQNRIRYQYYENYDYFEPKWLNYVYGFCLFSLTLLCIVIIL